MNGIWGRLYIHLIGKPRFYPSETQWEQALSVKQNKVMIYSESNISDQLDYEIQREVKGIKRVACDQISITLYKKIIETLKIEPLHGGDILSKVMRFYDKTEIEFVRKAAEIVDAGFKAARETIRPGIRELEVLAQMQYTFRSKGSEWDPWLVFGSGPNSAFSEATPTNRVIEKGDMIFIDIGPVYKGYPSDITRTFMVGEPTSIQRKILSSVLEVEMKAINMAREGVNAGKLDEEIRRQVTEKGFNDYKHHSGHALNYSFNILPGCSANLEQGDVICLEPGIYLPGVGGGRIEDEMIITGDAAEVITYADRDPYLHAR